MTEVLLQMLLGATTGLALVLVLRRPARRLFGAGPAFSLWLLPVVLACGPWLPQHVAPAAMVVLPGLTVTPGSDAGLPRAGGAFNWSLLLIGVWLAGAALSIARLAWQYLRLRTDTRRGSPEWLQEIGAAMPSLDARRVRSHADGPAVLWSLPRSLILLPPDFASRFDSAAARELVLRHELTHARRGDGWWTLAMEIASGLLWFHPLAWIARSRFRLDQELACDAAALRAMPDRAGHYARTLVDSVAARPVGALIPWLTEPQLKERIAMIIRIPPGALRRRAGFLAMAVLLAGGIWFAGGQVPVRAAAPAASGTASRPPSMDAAYRQEHPPRYPVEALHKGEQGAVMLDVTVDATGGVTNIQVDQEDTTASDTLQKAAIQAARGWKYHPGQQDGKPVGGVVRFPVNFALMPPTPADGTRSPADGSPSVDVKSKQRNPPAYPADALKKREHGVVMLLITVDPTGSVTKVAVDHAATTAPASLQASAVAAARDWKFEPGRENGKPVGGTVSVPITFSLQTATAPGPTSTRLMMRLHIDSNGKVDKAAVDHSYPTSVSREVQAKLVADIIGVPFSQGKGGDNMPSGWYTFPIPVPPAASSSGSDSVDVTATRIH